MQQLVGASLRSLVLEGSPSPVGLSPRGRRCTATDAFVRRPGGRGAHTLPADAARRQGRLQPAAQAV